MMLLVAPYPCVSSFDFILLRFMQSHSENAGAKDLQIDYELNALTGNDK